MKSKRGSSRAPLFFFLIFEKNQSIWQKGKQDYEKSSKVKWGEN